MDVWVIIFVTLLAIAFGIVAWLDRDEVKQRQRRNAADEKRNQSEE
jgi:predicted outer membrane lipoprotein